MVEGYLCQKVEKSRTRKSATECRRVLNQLISRIGAKAADMVSVGDCLDLANEQLDRGHNAQAGVMLRELAAAEHEKLFL